MKKYETPKLDISQFQTDDVAFQAENLAFGYSGSLITEESNPHAGGNIEEP